ncbi:hypothetical protein OEZ85_005066 [Tetradesmus obliquus]|uniref:F-box domain-containing protein n=1 Tax=Tetradesmus obliquus TaxID=3088 RepID=A0ABY8UH74_TETOB|nr:hypothetical protein OEZ85_005066 [Tetradesmus obliquus]
MVSRSQGGVLELPLETHVEICRWLDPRIRSHLSSSCRAFAAAGRLAPFSAVHAHIASDQIPGFSKWLQEHGSRITSITIQGPALHTQRAKSALWAALSAPNNLQQLQQLKLDMPLTVEDEAALLSCVCANAPSLTSLDLHYQRPLSHARKSNAMCFCAHSSAAPWAAAAGQLRALRVTGACFCNMSYVAQLTGLTLLQVRAKPTDFAAGWCCV